MNTWILNDQLLSPNGGRGDFAISMANPKQLQAVLTFRCPGGKVPDPTLGLIERLGDALAERLADSRVRANLTAMEARRDELQTRQKATEGKLAGIAARRADPKLLEANDLGSKVLGLDREQAILAQHQQETEAALKAVNQQLPGLRQRVLEERNTLGRQIAEAMHAEAMQRRKDLLARLAEVAGPVLDELIEAEFAVGATLQGALLARLPVENRQLAGGGVG